MSRLQRSGVAVGLLFLLLYAVLLFVPPAATYSVPPASDAGLWERVFPGVPVWWVVGRLICLFVGAGLIASSMRARLPLRLGEVAATPSEESNSQPERTRTLQRAALFVALAHATSGLFAARFNRLAETVYFLFLAAPAAILARTEMRSVSRTVRSLAPHLAALLIVPLLWLAVSIPTAWRSPRAANLVDMWIMVERLEAVAFGHDKVLAGSASPGHSNAYMMLEGISFIGPHGLPLSFTQLQISHFFWAVVCAVAIGVVVWKMVGQAAAITAQAVFLFSQYVLSSAYSPGPALIAPLCAVFLLLPVLAVREFRSTAALAAFGAVVGFSSTEPTVALPALLLCALMAYSVSRFSPVPWLAIGVATFSCVAAVLPALPSPGTLVAMARQYTFGSGQLTGVVMVLFGQRSSSLMRSALEAGRPEFGDIPLGALLAPFAIARTPHRLWGDALLDPAGTALMAIGLLLCMIHAARNRASVLVLGLLAAALVEAFTSTGDAVSHPRLAAALLPLAVCAGVGFETLRLAFASTWRPTVAAAITAALIATAGITIFGEINPGILPASWLATSLEALGLHDPNADAVVLDDGDPFGWLYVRRISGLLPKRALPTRTYSELERIEPTSADAQLRIYFWSPALEQDLTVSCLICDKWPGAALYTLMDEPRLFSAFAASPLGAVWNPHLPKERWAVSFCQAPTCRPDDAAWLTPSQLDAPHCAPATPWRAYK